MQGVYHKSGRGEDVTEKIKGYKTKNIGSLTLLLLLVGGYLIFFTSRFWLPASAEIVEPTPLYETETLDSYSVYLTKWEYSREDAAMEIVIEIQTSDLTDTGLTCSAFERNAGELDIMTVDATSEYMVFRINDVPEEWREVSLHLQKDGGKNTLRLYTNVDEVDQTERLPEKSKNGYQIDRLQGQIGYDDHQISLIENKKAALEKENSKLQERIDELERAVYPTEEEADDALERVEQAQKSIEENTESIQKHQEEISEIETRTERIQEQIRELETK